MGHKRAETVCNINNTFGSGTANECTVQWWFKKFCKGEEHIEVEEHSDQPSEVDNSQWRAVIKDDPLTTAQEVAEELNVDHSVVIRYLKQMEKVEKLDMWVLYKLTANKKNCPFKVLSLILHKNDEPFLDQIMTCNEKCILYDN